jgi:para-aminobenzoate synthetase component I
VVFLGRLLCALPPDARPVVVRDGATTIVGACPSYTLRSWGADALAQIDALSSGWWAGWLGYDLGRAVERVQSGTLDDRCVPDLQLARYDARLVLEPGADPRIEGHGPGRAILARALCDPIATGAQVPVRAWRSSLDRESWSTAVEGALRHIRAGDCYQVNLTRRLTSPERADPRALAATLWRDHRAPHAAFIETDDRTVVSASPERFLRVDGDVIETSPIKGTARSRHVLVHSAKDHAENVMIVDLARNDLGRICEYGTITVPLLCAVESHPGLHHLVSTVRGQLRPATGFGAIIRATFPPASITGAPKARVMQIIEGLEPVRRGVYCGAIGWIDVDHHRADLNVAIRTFTIGAHGTDFGVGAGIVADSAADAEWAETELKADRLLALAAGSGSAPNAPAAPAGTSTRVRLPA